MNTALICQQRSLIGSHGFGHEASDASCKQNPLSPSSRIFHSLDKNTSVFPFKTSIGSYDSLDSSCSNERPTLSSESSVDDSAILPLKVQIQPPVSDKRGVFNVNSHSPSPFDERKRGFGDCGCLSPAELTEIMMDDSDRQLLILLDVRENRVYHTSHIQGSRHANCTTKLMVKRAIANWNTWFPGDGITQGKAPEGTQVVIYDQKSPSPNTSKPLNAFLLHLLHSGNDVKFLQYGFEKFSSLAPKELISTNLTEDCIRQYSYSPTSPECPSEDVLNATASEILPYLYLGNERDTKDCDLLEHLGITHILNMTEHIPFHLEKLNRFEYKRLPASDCQQQDLRKFFPEAIAFIKEARENNGKVLVHCWAGVSRSASIVMAYLLAATHLPLAQVLEFTRKKRSIVAPNFNFMGQLERYSHSLAGSDESDVSGDLQDLVRNFLSGPVQPERSVSTSSSDSGVMDVDCPSPLIQIRDPFLK